METETCGGTYIRYSNPELSLIQEVVQHASKRQFDVGHETERTFTVHQVMAAGQAHKWLPPILTLSTVNSVGVLVALLFPGEVPTLFW